MDRSERTAFAASAIAFLEANASRRHCSGGEVVWGEGPDNVRVMGSEKPADEAALLGEAAAWRAKVFDAGFGWLGGPTKYGGGGRDPELDEVYRRLEGDFDVPDQSAYNVAWDMVAPAVVNHGSEQLKERFLRPIYRGDLLCSQLLSEPGAGSDLAGLRTRAVRDGDEWVVNGQKVWSSYAHMAKIGQLMARTDPGAPKHRGLTMFLLPLDSPGVDIRPLRQMNGDAEFNEVFLTDVRVPDANRVGAAGEGWRAVLTTLMSERASVGTGRSTPRLNPASLVMDLARHTGRESDPVMRQRLADVYIHRRLIEMVADRGAAERKAGRSGSGAEGSILKLLGSKQNCRIANVAAELLGPAIAADTGEWGTYSWSRYLCGTPGLRIAGGTDEIQRNILGERLLGLPR